VPGKSSTSLAVKFSAQLAERRGRGVGWTSEVIKNERADHFDAIVSSVTQVEEGRTKVSLLIFSGHTWEGQQYVKGRTPEGSVSTVWDNSQGPIPVITGQNVDAYVNSKREVLLIDYDCNVRFWRAAPDDRAEIAVSVEGDHSGLLLLKPAGISWSENVNWIPRVGVFLFSEGAGGADLEVEHLQISILGIPIRNVPDLRIQPGREGWHSILRTEDVNLLKEIKEEGKRDVIALSGRIPR
jgi:hypothetical protein